MHAGRECTKHARLATSQGIEQASRDDPHCSAAGTAVLSSPDEASKNAPSFGRSLAGGVEEDTPATDCQTHQEYASSLCGLHRCNRWTYSILTDL